VNDRDLERAAERFADTMNEAIAVRVQMALSLERDRMNAELAELRERVMLLERHAIAREYGPHSVRVKP